MQFPPPQLLAPAAVLLFAGAAAAGDAPPSPVVASSAKTALERAPKVKISNGLISAVVLTPDPRKGFYRGVRFDWSGQIASLTLQNHEFYGLWFDAIDPTVRDYVIGDEAVSAAPNTAALGPADAYDPAEPVGWKDAAPGGTFLKIGVGLLRKPNDDQPYSSYKAYDWVDPGKWTVRARRDSVAFSHVLSEPRSGFGYVYEKTLTLQPGSPVLHIRHRLRNTGVRPIATTTFNHNFVTFGGPPTEAGLEARAAFALEPLRPLRDVGTVKGDRLVYTRALARKEVFSTPFKVEGSRPYDIALRKPGGMGFSVKADHPLSALTLWSIARVAAFEPFIKLEVPPGGSKEWTFTYTYSAPSPQ